MEFWFSKVIIVQGTIEAEGWQQATDKLTAAIGVNAVAKWAEAQGCNVIMVNEPHEEVRL